MKPQQDDRDFLHPDPQGGSPRFRWKRAEESGRSMVMVKQVVEAHRGRVEIESAVGQGTRVLLRLPIVIP
ncbi:ATP-binding protein [Thermoflexus sp.]|uniref:ATP-binding protein n=1 Tax=Thermoflexus sp. TaxID=1969742 RepID=UPI00345868B7